MNDRLTKILTELILALVLVYFCIILFCSCRTKKIVATSNDSVSIEQFTTITEKITENAKYEEITYILDSCVNIPIYTDIESISKKYLPIKQIKVKKSVVSNENVKTEQIYTDSVKVVKTEEKTEKINEERKSRSFDWFRWGFITALIIIASIFIYREIKHTDTH